MSLTNQTDHSSVSMNTSSSSLTPDSPLQNQALESLDGSSSHVAYSSPIFYQDGEDEYIIHHEYPQYQPAQSYELEEGEVEENEMTESIPSQLEHILGDEVPDTPSSQDDFNNESLITHNLENLIYDNEIPPQQYRINLASTVETYDFITLENINTTIQEYIEEHPDNLVFLYQTTPEEHKYFLTKRSVIMEQYHSNIFHPCKSDNSSLDPSNYMKDLILFKLDSIGHVHSNHQMCSMIEFIRTPYNQLYVLEDLPIEFPSYVSIPLLHHEVDMLGAFHCQSNISYKISRLVRAYPSSTDHVFNTHIDVDSSSQIPFLQHGAGNKKNKKSFTKPKTRKGKRKDKQKKKSLSKTKKKK